MAKVRLVVSEAWASMMANVSTTLAATITVLISMLLLGVFIALGTWALSYSAHVSSELQVKVYFDTLTSQPSHGTEVQVGRRLQADPRVKDVVYVSRAAAFADQQKKYPALYRGVPANPLPDAWIVKPRNPKDAPTIGREIQSELNGTAQERSRWPGVESVSWGDKTTKRVIAAAEVLSIAFLVAIVLLVVASTLLIANTIRLSIFARRREIEVMKLVGATNWFIRGPFMIEGLLQGLAGSLIAIVLLIVGKAVVLPIVFGHIHSSGDVRPLPFALNALVLVGTGLALGAAGSSLTLRRFLQI